MDDLRYGKKDKNGWRIPRKGSISLKIYQLMCEGKSTSQIAKLLKHSYGSTRVIAYRIKNPDKYRRTEDSQP